MWTRIIISLFKRNSNHPDQMIQAASLQRNPMPSSSFPGSAVVGKSAGVMNSSKGSGRLWEPIALRLKRSVSAFLIRHAVVPPSLPALAGDWRVVAPAV